MPSQDTTPLHNRRRVVVGWGSKSERGGGLEGGYRAEMAEGPSSSFRLPQAPPAALSSPPPPPPPAPTVLDRRRGVAFILACCDTLSHDLPTSVASCVLWHRYLDAAASDSAAADACAAPRSAALACVYVAGKVGSHFRKCRDVVNCGAYVDEGDVPDVGEGLFAAKEGLLEEERRVLAALGYDCRVELPHAYLYSFAELLVDTPGVGDGGCADQKAAVATEATRVLGASLPAAAWGRLGAPVLGLAALLVACRARGVATEQWVPHLPDNMQMGVLEAAAKLLEP